MNTDIAPGWYALGAMLFLIGSVLLVLYLTIWRKSRAAPNAVCAPTTPAACTTSQLIKQVTHCNKGADA
jgi:hypothetical protein